MKIFLMQGISFLLPRLNEEGFKQAKSLAETLKDIIMDKIIVSPLTRTLQTATTVFPPETNTFLSSSV